MLRERERKRENESLNPKPDSLELKLYRPCIGIRENVFNESVLTYFIKTGLSRPTGGPHLTIYVN